MTKTDFYKDTFFECAEDKNSYIEAFDIAKILEFVLEQDDNIVLTDITIRPQKTYYKKEIQNNENFYILGSGSAGNSTYIEVDGYKILIDAGFSCKKIEEKLQQIGEKLEDISAILITHEHSDHINGAGIIARKYDIPLYISSESYGAGFKAWTNR